MKKTKELLIGLSVLFYGIFMIFIFPEIVYKEKGKEMSFVSQLRREYHVVDIKRITLCSAREFSGKTKSGYYSGENQVAVSRDLKKYLYYYAIIPSISKEIFFVSDTTHDRFKSTVDIYTMQPGLNALNFGVHSGKVVFISKKGIKLLGEGK